ncbi:MAG: 2-oxo acid dehydrogenase subunit E2 [Bacteroidota bacterium]
MADLREIVLPAEVGEGAESLVVMWYKEPGDSFEKDEILVEVQTDKAIFEVPAEFDGVLEEIVVNRGEVAAVGQVMAKAKKAGNEKKESQATGTSLPLEAQKPPSQTATVLQPAIKATPLAKKLARENQIDLRLLVGSGVGGKITDSDVSNYIDSQVQDKQTLPKPSDSKFKITPLARKIAKAHNIDLAMVTGSGKGGKITDRDVRTYMETLNTYLGTNLTFENGKEFEEVPNSPFRKATAKYMFSSLQNSAQLTLSRYIEVTQLNTNRKELMPKASWNDWVLRATVLALMEHREMNASWMDENSRKVFNHVNLGIAVDTERGLLVPIVKEADTLSFEALTQKAKEQQQKALNNKLKNQDIDGGTFTVTNLGGLGIDFFTPILNPPQVGILGVGRLQASIDIVENRLKRKWQLPLSITFDHRAIDGAPAARFLQTLEDLLAQPEKLL